MFVPNTTWANYHHGMKQKPTKPKLWKLVHIKNKNGIPLITGDYSLCKWKKNNCDCNELVIVPL